MSIDYTPTQVIELPLEAYEKFLELQDKLLRSDITQELARYETLELLSPYWSHQPEPWEATEVVLKKATTSLSRVRV